MSSFVCSVSSSLIGGDGKLLDGYDGEAITAKGWTDYRVGEIPTELVGRATPFRTGRNDSQVPTNAEVAALSKTYDLSGTARLMFDKDVRLASDEPNAKGHLRFSGSSFQ